VSRCHHGDKGMLQRVVGLSCVRAVPPPAQKESDQMRKRSWRAIRLSPFRTLIIQARDLGSGCRPHGSATARSRSIPVWPKKPHIASVALGPRGSVYDPALAPPTRHAQGPTRPSTGPRGDLRCHSSCAPCRTARLAHDGRRWCAAGRSHSPAGPLWQDAR
jgi:hypothetical protein